MRFRNLAVIVATLCMVRSVPAQTPARELTLDFRPFGGLLGAAWRTAPQWSAGIAAGGGVDELTRTIRPENGTSTFHTMEQIIHLSAFVRHKPTANWDLDLGARTGFGSLRTCDASDCWPGWYNGVYAGVSWGGERWKVGPRLLWALVQDSDHRDAVLHLDIITGRVSFGW